MRNAIATYLKEQPDGHIYYRMVDTVLSRDKNWARWKMEGCPEIKRAPVPTQDFLDARAGANRKSASKRLRATPVGSVDLTFLSDADNDQGLEVLKDPSR